MIEVICLLLTELVLCWCFVVRPVEWHAAPGWYMEGVRPDGSTRMRPATVRDPEFDGTWLHPERTPFDPRWIGARIWCTGGARPAVSADRVWCQRW